MLITVPTANGGGKAMQGRSRADEFERFLPKRLRTCESYHVGGFLLNDEKK
jgi:hypothetical protein